MPTPEEVIAKMKEEAAARKRGEDVSKNNNISEQNNAVIDDADKSRMTSFEAPSTNELVRDGDPLDINKTDSNSVDSGVDSNGPVESRGPGNDKNELNPSDDKPNTPNAGDAFIRTDETTKRLPPNFMSELAVILKDSGADTRSQSTSLAKIEELIEGYNKPRSEFIPGNATPGNTNVAVSGTKKVPMTSELPNKE